LLRAVCRRGRRRYVGNFHSWRDYDFLRDFFVDGLDVVVTVSVVEDADDGGMGAGQGAEDAAFGAAIGADGSYFDEDAIAVHGGSDGVRGNEDVAGEARFQIGIERVGFGDDEAIAVAMHGEAADEEIVSLGHQFSVLDSVGKKPKTTTSLHCVRGNLGHPSGA
jgi:hypothetical protein